MIRTRARRDRAFAISTICRSGTDRSRISAPGRIGVSSRASSAAAASAIALWSRRGPRVISRPRKMFAATDRSGTRLNSWWITTIPAASAAGPLR